MLKLGPPNSFNNFSCRNSFLRDSQPVKLSPLTKTPPNFLQLNGSTNPNNIITKQKRPLHLLPTASHPFNILPANKFAQPFHPHLNPNKPLPHPFPFQLNAPKLIVIKDTSQELFLLFDLELVGF